MTSVSRQIVTVALLLATVIGVFVAGQLGQRNLENVTARIELGAKRQQALADVLKLLRQAESSQRGYILLGNPAYIAPYQQAVDGFAPALGRLDEAFDGAGSRTRAEVARLKELSTTKLAEMRSTVDAFSTRGRAAALQLMRTDIGETTMAEIDTLGARIEELEETEALDASRRWQVNRWVSLASTSAALVASAGLLLLLSRLSLRNLRSKERETEILTLRQAELERLIEQRTEELSALSTHLQSVSEQEKASLSRELHDELGGLLVAARMDLSWLEARLGVDDPEVRGYFRRVHDALQAGVNIKRRVIESLRPTLLDNLGLIPALRWQVSQSCERGGLRYTEKYPAEELVLTPDAAIAVFRIVQEALANVLKHARASTVDIELEISPPWLVVQVQDDGVGPSRSGTPRTPAAHGLAAMRHRARALGGHCHVHPRSLGGTRIEVQLPIDRVLATTVEHPERLIA